MSFYLGLEAVKMVNNIMRGVVMREGVFIHIFWGQGIH